MGWSIPLKQQFSNNEIICKSMVFGVKSSPAVGDKSTVINMIINRWQTFPFVDVTWLDSDGKYHILCWGSILEIVTMFRIKPSYLKKHDIYHIIQYNLLLIY